MIELVIIIVVMAIAAASMMSMNVGIFTGQTESRTMEVGAGLMQECAEMILAKGNKNYADATLVDSASATALCASATFGGNAAPAVTVTAVAAGSGACPSGGVCKQFSIAQGGLSPIVLVLVK